MEKAEYELIKQVQEDHWWFNSTRDIVNTMCSDVFERSHNEDLSFLDLGCGPGSFTSLFSKYGEVTCCDIDLGSLESIDSNDSVLRVQGSGEYLSFEDNSFDAVFMITVLYHIKDDNKALSEVYRVLKPGGRLFIVEPAFNIFRRAHDKHVHGLRRYKKKQLKNQLINAKFEILNATYSKMQLAPFALLLGFKERLIKSSSNESRSDLESRGIEKMLVPFFKFWSKYEDKLCQKNIIPFGTSVIINAVKK